jgi:hypothetical protein
MTRVGPPPHAAWVGGNLISVVVRAAAAVRIHRCYDCRADRSGRLSCPKKGTLLGRRFGRCRLALHRIKLSNLAMVLVSNA